jgi:hypothetical protein
MGAGKLKTDKTDLFILLLISSSYTARAVEQPVSKIL